ncbi:MAG TPA: hypothetical protein VMW57_09020 [Methyloceanibacter sp.]|nr:hypothetical protein [Methyloceanibacter sp.]
MTRHAIARLLIAAVLLGVAPPAAVPALAASNSQASDGAYVVKKQSGKKAKSTKSKKACVKTAPPFIYNPRFMNRSFFKCREQ